jgi:putative FmdB family regulatory protein
VPTYDYHCYSCGHGWEEFQSITAPKLNCCPECGEGPPRRLVGKGGAVIFRGSGFYCTDYPKEKRKESGGQEPD